MMYFKKMTSPVTAAMIAETSTAAADKSFTLPMMRLCPGETRLHNCSMAVLNSSAIKTAAMDPITAIHSARLILKYHPAPAAVMAASRWILKLISERKQMRSPLAAY